MRSLDGYHQAILQRMLRQREGERLIIYPDHRGNLTVGVGHLLAPGGRISVSVQEQLFADDLHAADQAVSRATDLHGLEHLNMVRRLVLLDMAFQMGLNGLLGFKKMLAALADSVWQRAHDELLDSDYGRDEHLLRQGRPQENARMLLSGRLPWDQG